MLLENKAGVDDFLLNVISPEVHNHFISRVFIEPTLLDRADVPIFVSGQHKWVISILYCFFVEFLMLDKLRLQIKRIVAAVTPDFWLMRHFSYDLKFFLVEKLGKAINKPRIGDILFEVDSGL
jgi:hypothetical protein